MDTCLFHRNHLLRSSPFSSRDDCPCMTHATARGSGAARNETDDRFGKMFLYILRGFFLGSPTDLADHYDRVRSFIIFEELERIEESGPHNRVAADPNARGLSESQLGDLPDSLV